MLAEPVTVKQVSPARFALDFLSMGNDWQHYVAEADSPLLNDSFKQGSGFIGYFLGIGRPSNMAITRGLARGGYFDLDNSIGDSNPHTSVVTAYGSASEISRPTIIETYAQELTRNGRYLMRLDGMRHGGGDDIDLHAAIMLEGLALASQDS